MLRLASILCLVLEAHCMAGLRDQQYSSIGRASIVVKIDDKEDTEFIPNERYLRVTFTKSGAECSRWLVVRPEEFERAQLGRSYSLVKVRALRHADPWAIEFEEPK